MMPGGSTYTYRNPQTGFSTTVTSSQRDQMIRNAANNRGLDVSSWFSGGGSSGSSGNNRGSSSSGGNNRGSSGSNYSSGGNSSSRSGSSSGSSGGGMVSSMVPIRSAIESRYGQGSVEYNPQTGTITLRDPSTGRVGTIAPNAYTEQGGTAYINPSYIQSWLNGGSGGSAGGQQVSPQASQPRYSYGSQESEQAMQGALSSQPQYYQDENGSWRVSGPSSVLAGSNIGVGGNTIFLPSMENANSPLDIVNTPAGSVGVWTNPVTGETRSTLPSGMGEQAGVPDLPPYWWQSMYQAQQQPLLQAQPEYLQSQAQNILDQFQQAYTPDASLAPLYSKALDQMMASIDTYQQQLTDQIKQQMGGVDPATQTALASLKDTVKKQRDAMMEEMSRRGLLQSGLWMEAENQLNKGELTAQQQLLNTRLTALQDQLNQALQNFGNMRLNAMQTYGLKGIEQLNTEAQRRQEALQKNLEQALDQAYKQRQLDIQQFQVQSPYLYGTWAQRNQLPQDWAKITGTVPAGPGYEPVPVRDYVGSQGSVSYDPNTGNVLINGQPINPSAVGGYITPEGRSYIPRNIVDAALRRY